jgi:predicted metal-dependent HD superfamily phosphohydrolase
MSIIDQAWEQCFVDLDVSRPPPCTLDELKARYSEPPRAYHTMQHIEECFAWFGQAHVLAHAKGEVACALLYHDAIYDTHASDNEQKSANLALSVIEEYSVADTDVCDRVESLILATRHAAEPRSQDEQLLVDIDLAILGAAPARFDEYEQQVRREYAWVEEANFRRERGRILRQFLERPTLYSTTFFRERLEDQARHNLSRAIAALGG